VTFVGWTGTRGVDILNDQAQPRIGDSAERTSVLVMMTSVPVVRVAASSMDA